MGGEWAIPRPYAHTTAKRVGAKWATIARCERRAGFEQRAAGPSPKPGKLRQRARRTDAKPQLVEAARFIRQLLPGDDRYGDPLSTTGTKVPQRIGRVVSEVQPERPSAVRELGLGALQAWQALSEAQGRGRGNGGRRDPVHGHRRILLLGARRRRRGGARAAAPGRRRRGRRDLGQRGQPGEAARRRRDGRVPGRRAGRFTPRFRRRSSLVGSR